MAFVCTKKITMCVVNAQFDIKGKSTWFKSKKIKV